MSRWGEVFRNRSLERNNSRGTGMNNLDQNNDKQPNEPKFLQLIDHYNEESQEWEQWGEVEVEDPQILAMTGGKGGSKGFRPTTWIKTKGFGKGGKASKGKGTPTFGKGNGPKNEDGKPVWIRDCYRCGLIGHSGTRCGEDDVTCSHCSIWGHRKEVCPIRLECIKKMIRIESQ